MSNALLRPPPRRGGDSEPLLCIAVMNETDPSQIDVIDSSGKSRVFRTSTDITNKRLCFSTHGAMHGTDGLLSPCFDEFGNHGSPDEGCFCGVDTPHLHAHVHDPRRCVERGSTMNGGDIGFLAQLTLYPDDSNGEESHSERDPDVAKIPVCESLPNDCNSSQVREAGWEDVQRRKMYKVQHDDHYDYLVHNDRTGDLHLEHSCESCGDTDVHGKLDLVHKRSWEPEDGTDSHIQLHFFRVSRKPFQLLDAMSELFCIKSDRALVVKECAKGCCSNATGACTSVKTLVSVAPVVSGSSKSPTARLYFKWEESWEDGLVTEEEMKKIICSMGGVENVELVNRLDMTRLLLKHANNEGSASEIASILEQHNLKVEIDQDGSGHSNSTKSSSVATTARSELRIKNMCCSSESKVIHKILDKIKGIEKVLVNVPLKVVYIHHDPSVITASEMASLLNKERLGANVTKEGAVTHSQTKKNNSGLSRFIVGKICLKSDIDIPHIIETKIRPLPWVAGVNIAQSHKGVYIDHDPTMISESQLEMAINARPELPKVHFEKRVSISLPANKSAHERTSSTRIGRSSFFVDKICCASEIPAINSVVQPLQGVVKVSINITTKTVYVDHNINILPASKIEEALNDERFGARVMKDAGADAALAASTIVETTFVESTLVISNLFSEVEESEITKVFSAFSKKQVRGYVIHVPSQTVKMDHDPKEMSAKSVMLALKKGGLEAYVASDGEVDGNWSLPLLNREGESIDEIERHVARISPHVVLSGVFWILSMFSFIGGNWEYLKYVALLAVVCGAPPIAIKCMRTLRRCQFDANCMMFFAIVGAVALQEYPEAAAVTFLFSISEWLEARATSRARNALSAIVNLRPEKANLIHPISQKTIMVPASAVAVGAKCLVRTGDKIPCDGVVLEGGSVVDESSLTGESRPVKKNTGDKVSGGTINVGLTYLTIETTSTVDDSAVARLIRLVEEAQANQSPTEKFIDEFAKRYTPVVVLAALCMCTIPWAFGVEVGQFWVKNGLITIVIACPCALVISTPVTYVAGLAATARSGIVVKGGAVLEALGQVQNICFDKTGTLTQGNFGLIHFDVTSDTMSRKQVLTYLALVESTSSHPIAAAIMSAAKDENVHFQEEQLQMSDHKVLEGEGLTALVNGNRVYVGNTRLLDRVNLANTLTTKQRLLMDGWAAEGGTVGFISVETDSGNGQVVGIYCVTDAVRDEARGVVAMLHSMGIGITMLTGDSQKAAHAVGNYVGLDHSEIKAQLFPKDKLDLVGELKNKENTSASLLSCTRKRLVLMCGDGVNDAPALASADVGVAMGAGAALAMETSDVTLLDSNLDKLVYCLKMGHRVTRTINENVIFSLAAKAIVMGFTFAGMSTLWVAIASDVGAMLIVTLNGMKLLPRENRKNRYRVWRSKDDEESADVTNGQTGIDASGVELELTSSLPTRMIASHDHDHSLGHKSPVIQSTQFQNNIGDEKTAHEDGYYQKNKSSDNANTECKKACCGTDTSSDNLQSQKSSCDMEVTLEQKSSDNADTECRKGCCGTGNSSD